MHSVQPVPFYFSPKGEGLERIWMCVDKVHNVDLHIRDSIVAGHVEMMPDSIFLIADADVVEVALETVHQSPFGLSNVLHVAVLARDAVLCWSILCVLLSM